MSNTTTAMTVSADSESSGMNEEASSEWLILRMPRVDSTAVSLDFGERTATRDDAQDISITVLHQSFHCRWQLGHGRSAVVEDIQQQFSGVVTAIDSANRTFTARLSDSSNPSAPDEMVTLGFEQILSTDIHRLAIGDAFFWFLGYERGMRQSLNAFSKIRFRHFPAWSQQEINAAAADAEELFRFFHKKPP